MIKSSIMLDIEMLNVEEVSKVLSWITQKTAHVFDDTYQCESRDKFQAKLDNFYSTIKKPLLTAVVGEIGNNSFDHNLGSWFDVAGVYFRFLPQQNLVILADRGQGVRSTLSRIIPSIKSDKEALEIAFTKVVSGRSPEHRGNGLKFVSQVLKGNGFKLYFQSGSGAAYISEGRIDFLEKESNVNGCMAIIKY